MTRQEAREFMMQVFFQMEACGDFDVNNRDNYMNQTQLKNQKGYCNDLFSLLCNKREEIDNMINQYSKNWKINRMPKTDVAVLRLSTCEIVYLEDVPTAVSINEAVELAKKYGTDDSGKYVNGILGNVASAYGKKDA